MVRSLLPLLTLFALPIQGFAQGGDPPTKTAEWQDLEWLQVDSLSQWLEGVQRIEAYMLCRLSEQEHFPIVEFFAEDAPARAMTTLTEEEAACLTDVLACPGNHATSPAGRLEESISFPHDVGFYFIREADTLSVSVCLLPARCLITKGQRTYRSRILDEAASHLSRFAHSLFPSEPRLMRRFYVRG